MKKSLSVCMIGKLFYNPRAMCGRNTGVIKGLINDENTGNILNFDGITLFACRFRTGRDMARRKIVTEKCQPEKTWIIDANVLYWI